MGGETTTITFLFTDLVRSTELATAVGEYAADRMRKEHFRILRHHVSAHGGREIKSMGDGLMVAFPSATDGVSCAVAMQRAVDRANHEHGDPHLGLRVGVNTGDAIEEDGDYYGLPVVIAKRLCDAAEPGQVLTSTLVRLLTGTRSGHAFDGKGSLSLKGIRKPVEAFEVIWESVPAVALPVALAAADYRTFVGREAERRRLDDAWKHSANHERRVALVVGEPGIGKTRLAVELARRVYSEGATVLFGHCDEKTLVPFQPFVEALGQYAAVAPGDELTKAVGSNLPVLARLVPEVADKVGTTNERGDPETDRYRLFEAVTALISSAAERAPVLIVIDDLQWADQPTVQLLLHAVRRLPLTRWAVVGTYRDVEIHADHPLATALADLAREPGVDRLLLRGLSQEEVVELLEVRAGHAMMREGLELAEAVHRETEGNPFFVDEILRHLVESGAIYLRDGTWLSAAKSIADIGIPEGVRDVIGRRLARLSEDAKTVLTHASVLGREFTEALVEAVSGLPDDRVLRALEQGLTSQLVEEAAGPRPTFVFSHALIRHTLYEGISLARRQRLHLRAAEALEQATERRQQPGTIAAHYRAARSAADPEKIVDWSLRAGAAAIAVAAFEEAQGHFEAAIGVLEEMGVRDARLAQLLIFLGDLLYASGSDYGKEIGSLERAIDLFTELGDEVRTAQTRSRLGRSMSSFVKRMDIPRALEEFRLAEAVLGREPQGPALGFVLTGIATASLAAVRPTDAVEAARQARELAERLGNESLAANAAMLLGSALVTTGMLADGFELLEEAWQTAQRLNNPTIGYLSALFTAQYRTDLCDPIPAREVMERELGLPYLVPSGRQFHMVRFYLGTAAGWAGDLKTAGEMNEGLQEAEVRSIGELPGWEGQWAEALAQAQRTAAEVEAAGEMRFFAFHLWEQSRWRSLAGDHAGGLQLLDRAVDIVHREHPNYELKCRETAARSCVAVGNLNRAQDEVARCRQITSTNEDWLGLPGLVDRTEATLLAAQNDLSAAEPLFARAVDTFRRRAGPWEEAETFIEWARAFGDPAKFDAAEAIYERIGAGEAWFQRVRTFRAESSKPAALA